MHISGVAFVRSRNVLPCYGAMLSSFAMSVPTILMVSRCQVSRFQSPQQAMLTPCKNGGPCSFTVDNNSAYLRTLFSTSELSSFPVEGCTPPLKS